MKKTLNNILAACLIVMFSTIAYADPSITCTPKTGVAFGGTEVTIIIADGVFPPVPDVRFGDSPATGITRSDDKTIKCQAPLYPTMPVGNSQVKVLITVKGTLLSCEYTYTAPSISPISGPTCGGTKITIKGEDLDNAKVSFVGKQAIDIVPKADGTEVTCKSPSFLPMADIASAVDVAVTNSDGRTVTLEKAYTYTRIPDTERAALESLYDDTNGSEWSNKWDKNAPKGSECSWDGVICSTDGKNVIAIDLSDNNLVGNIPPAIKDLSKLTGLNLSDNNLIGDIPVELANLTFLTSLDLGLNALSCDTTGMDAKLRDFLNRINDDWQATQTAEPSGLKVEFDYPTATAVKLSWTPPACTKVTISGYEIEYSAASDFSSKSTKTVSGSNNGEVADLTQCTDYYFKVRSFSEKDGKKKYSDYVQLDVTPPVKTLGIPESERQVLIALYNLTTGDSWLNKTGWKDVNGEFAKKGSEGGWYGITCEKRDSWSCLRVTKIKLRSNNLYGDISDLSFLSDLEYLEELDLGDNRLWGKLPSWGSGKLQSLSTLSLDKNELDGTIPENFKNLVNLKKLSIAGNQIAGPVPSITNFFSYLDNGGSDFRWNKLYVTQTTLGDILSQKQTGGDWKSSQTICPKVVSVIGSDLDYVELEWVPDGDITNEGGYNIYWSLTETGVYRLIDPDGDASTATVAGKNNKTFKAEGLEPGTKYYFKVQAVTDVHVNNKNMLKSDNFAQTSGTTSVCTTCCPKPVIQSIVPPHASALGVPAESNTVRATITGKNFKGATVKFGDTEIPDIFINSTYTEIKVFSIPSINTVLGLDPQSLQDKKAVDVTISNEGCGSTTAANFYTYDPPPHISTPIIPNSGYAIGGMTVSIKGKNFVQDGEKLPTVKFGGKAASSVKLLSASELTCKTPDYGKILTNQYVDVVAVNPDGQSSPSCSGCFRYDPNPIPEISSITPNKGTAGIYVTIKGKHFKGVKDVKFGGKSATEVRIVSDSDLASERTCKIPENPPSTVSVTLTNPDDQESKCTDENCKFTYEFGMIKVEPYDKPGGKPEGPATGNQKVRIIPETGSLVTFDSGASVTFVVVPAIGVQVISPTEIVCWTPEYKVNGVYAGAQVEVIVSNPSGQKYKGYYNYHIIPDKEKQALDALFEATKGAGWRSNSGWKDKVRGKECEWYGVTCNEMKSHVTEIHLASNNLNGTIPSSIGNFEYLEKLNFLGNGLTGTIPEEIENLKKLQEIDLHYDRLEGPIPEQIMQLTNLVSLDFRDNKCLCVSADCYTDPTDPLFAFLTKRQVGGSFEEEQDCYVPKRIQVTPTTLNIYEKQESGKPSSADFTVSLDAAPKGDVVINLLNSDESECSLSSAVLTLNAANPSQTVTVTAEEDGSEDGTKTCTIITEPSEAGHSDDTVYNLVNPDNVTVFVHDSDTKLSVDFINPSVGELGKDLSVGITGTGFDGQTSVTVTGENSYSRTYSPSEIQVNTFGNFIRLTINHPENKGKYEVTVSNSKGTTDPYAIFFGYSSRKKAVIIGGGSPGDDLWNATWDCTNRAYKALISQQYSDKTIYYLRADYLSNPNKDITGDGTDDFDGDASAENLRNFIQNFSDEANKDTVNKDYELLIYMTGHGGDGFFKIKGETKLSADALNGYLADFPGRVILIYDACMSGSFISKMTPPAGQQRIVITGTSKDEPAYFAGDNSFSYWFWDKVKTNNNLGNCFNRAKNMMSVYQTVSVDANGNKTPNETDDMSVINGITIGHREADPPYPKIGEAGVDPKMLCDTATSAKLWVSDITVGGTIAKVEARIISVESTPAAAVPLIVTSIPPITLEDSDGDGKYEATYDKFESNKAYKISFFVTDTKNNVSDSVTSEIKQCSDKPVIEKYGIEPQTLCPKTTSATLWVSEITAKEAIKNVKAEILSLDSSPPVTVSSPDLIYVDAKKRYEATYTEFTGNAYKVSFYATDEYDKVSEPVFSTIKPRAGDINNDCTVDLKDAITVLQILTTGTSNEKPVIHAEVDNDGQIGLAEAVFILRELAK